MGFCCETGAAFGVVHIAYECAVGAACEEYLLVFVIEWLVASSAVASKHDHEERDEFFVGSASFDRNENRPLGGVVHDEHHAFLPIHFDDVGAPRIFTPHLGNGPIFEAQMHTELLGEGG